MVKEKKNLNISDFDYSLPDERIAKFPLAERDMSKLLIFKDNTIAENIFLNISNYLPAASLLVYNDTKVIYARLDFEKSTGAHIEIFCLEPSLPSDYERAFAAKGSCLWKCMIGNFKKWKNEGVLCKKLIINELEIIFSAKKIESDGNTHTILFEWNNANITFSELLQAAGELPIPPYLHRKTEKSDLITYQTVYSKIEGSVAAPTAGLHFTERVFEKLLEKNIESAAITLHVGAGTFQPVKTENALEHKMHAEFFIIKKEILEKIIKNLGNIIAVGTTSMRTLESLYYIGYQLNNKNFTQNQEFHVSQFEYLENESSISIQKALENIVNYLNNNNLIELRARTEIMVSTNYEFRLVDALITNFHQPRSTLLMLVSAFVGDENRKTIYDYALAHDFRFLSYGDSSLLFKFRR